MLYAFWVSGKILSDDMTMDDWKSWSKKEQLQLCEYMTSSQRIKPGDPGDLRRFKQDLIACTLGECAPNLWATTSFNDPNIWDLHRPEILPYKEVVKPIRRVKTQANPSSFAFIESQMMSGGYEDSGSVPKGDIYSRDDMIIYV